MDSSRMGRRGQDPEAETDEMIFDRLKEELETRTYKEKVEELLRLKKELEESIGKDTGKLVKAFTNPELSNLQMKIAKSTWRKEVMERELKILKCMKINNKFFSVNVVDMPYEGLRRTMDVMEKYKSEIENAPPTGTTIPYWKAIKAVLQMSGVEIPENVSFGMGNP